MVEVREAEVAIDEPEEAPERMVEGVDTVGGRILVAWVAGVLLALASLNHVIVVTLELIFGMRFGADITGGEAAVNFAIAAAGNMIGGLLFVTFTRTSQIGSGDTNVPTK
jgi:formate-nitrite transporter family protein